MNKVLIDEQDLIEPQTTSSFSRIVKDLESTDLNTQANLYRQLLDSEVQALAGQLRHRAAMMRQRADEFDEIADGALKHVEKIVSSSFSFEETHKNILELIDRHSFIQPTKVHNNG